jgi:hypothetical protein
MPTLQGVRALKQNITGGAFEALSAVPAFEPGSRAWLLEAWGADSAHVADFSVRSPSFHDNVRGIRSAYQVQPSAGKVQRFLPGIIRQQLYKTDTLIVEVNGTATDNTGYNMLWYFENLSGGDQQLMSWAEVDSVAVDIVGIFVNPTAGASGDYGATRFINADDDRLIADTKYALLGAVSQIQAETMAIVGPETSGRRITMPLMWAEQGSGQWFVELSNRYSLPMIPVFNANNRGQISVAVADANGATVPHVTLLFMELSS